MNRIRRMALIASILLSIVLSAIPVSAYSPIPYKTDCYASSTQFGGIAARACDHSWANDGTPATVWVGGSGYPQWIIENLTSPHTIVSVAIYTGADIPTSGHVDVWTGTVWVAYRNFTNANLPAMTNTTLAMDRETIVTSSIRIYGVSSFLSNYMTIAEIGPIGNLPPAAPSCKFGPMGTTLETLIPILISAALISFGIGFFLIATEKKSKRDFNMGYIIIAILGIIIAVAVAAGVVSSMKIC